MAEYSEHEKKWIWLASISDVGPKTFYYILKEFGDAAAFYDAVESGSEALEKVSQKVRGAAQAVCFAQYIAEMVCALQSKGIRAVTRLSEEYPAQLAKISYPPPVLFVKGSLADIGLCVGIVGTRRCSRKGAEAALRIAADLGKAGVTVVSGMALGIDTAAHQGAISAGGKTVAVLGCGADVVYPQGSEEIYEYAIHHGAVVSELEPGTKPFYANFPARNRIITGMCSAVLIVESEMEGGTAISATAAIAQGRDVFAVPGAPGQPFAALPNMLIKQGAAPVTVADDILRFYGVVDKNLTKKTADRAPDEQIQLDFLQREIYNLLLQGDMSVEEIASGAQFAQSELNVTLTMMELSGLIKRLPGGKYGI